MIYDLPTSVDIQGQEYEIRSDYRAILDICIALNDPELTNDDKALAALDIFYPSFEDMPPEHYQEALDKCMWFINCGSEDAGDKHAPKLMDWEQDFQYIVAPVNRVCGQEIRAAEYMHWWSFVSAYYEIGGDCTFSQIVRVRDRLARGKSLDKSDREWYRRNRALVDLKTKYTEAEEDVLKAYAAK